MKKSIDLLKEKLEPRVRGIVKSIYIGDPYILPESALPALLLNPVRTDSDIIDNQRDTHVHTIDINLVTDARRYFNSNPNEMVGMTFLMEAMEKENDDGSLFENSILYILRKNTNNLGTNRFIRNINSIDYSIRKRTEDLITLEAVARIEIEYLVNRPS